MLTSSECNILYSVEKNMGTIDARDAAKEMDSLLDAVSRGESFAIARGGIAVAQMVPVGIAGATLKKRKRMPDLTEFRASLHVFGKSLSDALRDVRKNTRY